MIPRYEYAGIAEVWSPEETYARWHRIEVVHIKQVAGTEVAELLARVRTPNAAQVGYHEAATGHDVAAFLRALDENTKRCLLKAQTPDEIARWKNVRSSLHFGLTSSDLVDTAQAMALQECAPVVVGLVEKLERQLFGFINRVGLAETVGRTHGQLAAPMGAWDRWQVLGEMIGRQITRLRAAFDWADVGKLSGPVGNFNANEDYALAELDLRAANATQIVSRDRLAHLAGCLGLTTTVCEAVATQSWLLNQQGIDEIQFRESSSAVGSSAMPHKRNPIAAENIRGLARMARSRAEELQLSVVQWGEHDLAHSSVERVAVPDLLHLTCTALYRTTALVSGMVWQPPTVPADYRDTSEELRSLQASGTPYVDAHAQLTALYRDGKITTTTGTEEAR